MFLALACAVSPLKALQLELSNVERQWIAENPDVDFGLVVDNKPYSFYLNGTIMGLSVDIIDRISKITGLHLKPRLGSWSQVYSQFRQGGLDVIADISFTEERSSFINFSEPYHLRRTVLFENIDHPLAQPVNIEELKGKRLGVIRDIYYVNALRKAGIEPVEYTTYRDLMASVAFGWVDAALAAEMTGNFFVRENGFTNVVAAGTIPLTGVSLEDFRLGVLKSDNDESKQMLAGILDKAVAAFTTEELDAITDRWLAFRSGRIMNGPLRLLPEEQAFIEHAPPFKIGFMIDYEPFSYLDAGRGLGLAVDLAHYIGSQTGVVFEPVFDNWAYLLDAFERGEIDVIANISYTDTRADFTLFSDMYHRIPNAVFARYGSGPYRKLEDLDDKVIGIARNIYYADAVRGRFERVREFDGQNEIMHALADGKIDAVITSLSNGTAIIRRDGLINIEIGGEFLMKGVERDDLRFGVSPKYPYLESIINRSLAAIPPARWREMENRWLGPPVAGMERQRPTLNDEELSYLAKKGALRVCVEPGAHPYTVIGEDGAFQGAVADVMSLLAERGGFAWKIEPIGLGNGIAEDATASNCDIVPFIEHDNVSQIDFDLAPSYLNITLAVASQLQAPFIESMRELDGQRVGIVPTHVPAGLLRRRYPGVTLIELVSEKYGLDAVAEGEIDAVVGPLDSLAFLIARMGTNEVKISGRISENAKMATATASDDPKLGDIFEKLIMGLPPEAVEGILNRARMAPFKREVDYRALAAIASVVTIVFILFLYWVRKLRTLNRALNEANSQLHKVSITDGLTGLFNRSYFIQRGEVEFEICKLKRLRFTLSMLDVDNFKPINDRMGHVFGDVCLVHLAKLLRQHFQRSVDLVARYGGEEFIAFSTSGDADSTTAYLERLRTAVEERAVKGGSEAFFLTVSMGFHSAIPEPNQTLEEFINFADNHLYDAKRTGRNRVVGNI